MKKSIFFKLALFILPIVLLLNTGILFLLYNLTYNRTLEANEKNIKNAAQVAVVFMKYCYPESDEDREKTSTSFTSLCNIFDIVYLYAIDPNVETTEEEYIAIGFGKDALEEAKATRYPGVVVEGRLSEEIIDVYNGDDSGVIRRVSNEFGDTIICYMPVTQFTRTDYRDGSKYTVDLDHPVVIGAEVNISVIMKEFQHDFFLFATLSELFAFLLVITLALTLYFRISRPVRKISKRMEGFVSDRDKKFEELPVKGNDELSEMSRSFNIMAKEIDTYIKDINKLNKEKITRDAELNIAHKIQSGLLQPPSYRSNNVIINASMLAAKDVGGDLYDYRILNDGRVYLIIADVSGKGISAALFMSRAVTLLQQYAMMGYSPAQMLTAYNDTLAANNPNWLFITTFVALYQPETGELRYANAGHNHPYIISDKLIELSGSDGVSAGVFAGEKYEEVSVTLKEGDILFMYTDGVNEAENTQGEFFGTEALEEELSRHIGAGTDDVINDVLNRVQAFADGATQSDDITIISMKVAPKPLHKELCVPAKAENLTAVNDFIINEQTVPDDLKPDLCQIAEEMFVNICSYAYPNHTGEATVTLDISPDMVTITFIDSGEPFDSTKLALNPENHGHDSAAGAPERFTTFSIADEYSYIYQDSKNILRITKRKNDKSE